jgi:hypothetical protein
MEINEKDVELVLNLKMVSFAVIRDYMSGIAMTRKPNTDTENLITYTHNCIINL